MAVPIGISPGDIVFRAANVLPDGFLKANGATISRTTYAALFAAIGTTFGVGDGSTTFKIPDLRGEFVRGWDDSRGIDSGRAFGSAQADELKSHTHDASSRASNAGAANNFIAIGSTNVGAGTISLSSTGGAETRPRNIALLACIKY